jgi:LysM repeat protein
MNRTPRSVVPARGRPSTRARSWAAIAAGLAWAASTLPGAAEGAGVHPRAAEAARGKGPAEPPPVAAHDPMQSLGSISVGRPNTGFLVNGVQMPAGDAWVVSLPEYAWGTDETIEALIRAFRRVDAEFPGGPRAILGSISAEHGGPLPPHRSHRSGRDADVHLYLTVRKPNTWYEPGTAENLDRPRCWAFIEALIEDADLDFILLDQSVQDLLEEYALSIGRDPAWVTDLFDGTGPGSDLIKHVPGHQGHFHVRFASPYSRRRGVDLYDRLVEQRIIEPPTREVRHVVVAGDTLIGLGHRYGVAPAAIQEKNGLDSALIRVGQELTVVAPVDVPGAREPVVVPRRRLPPTPPPSTRQATAEGRPAPSRASPPTSG